MSEISGDANILGAKAQQSLSVDMQVLFLLLLLLLLCWLLFSIEFLECGKQGGDTE